MLLPVSSEIQRIKNPARFPGRAQITCITKAYAEGLTAGQCAL
jgi:hypothetical protein